MFNKCIAKCDVWKCKTSKLWFSVTTLPIENELELKAVAELTGV